MWWQKKPYLPPRTFSFGNRRKNEAAKQMAFNGRFATGKGEDKMEEKTIFEQLGGQYKEVDGILYPQFEEEEVTTCLEVGKYGLLWLHFMEENHKDCLRILRMKGKLFENAKQVNEEAHQMIEIQMAKYLKKHKPEDPNSTMERWMIMEQAIMSAEEFVLINMVYVCR